MRYKTYLLVFCTFCRLYIKKFLVNIWPFTRKTTLYRKSIKVHSFHYAWCSFNLFSFHVPLAFFLYLAMFMDSLSLFNFNNEIVPSYFQGQNILVGQYIFCGLYVLNLALVFRILGTLSISNVMILYFYMIYSLF